MQNQSLCESRQFTGCLNADNFDIPVIFRAHINQSGEITFDFDNIPITQETSFLLNYFVSDGTSPKFFSLIGQSDDGTELKAERIHFSSESFYGTESEHVRLSEGRCTRKATFTKKTAEIGRNPWIRMELLSFKGSHSLSLDSHLGTISMLEHPPINDSSDITGFLQIEAKNELLDISVWHDDAIKLLEHVRHVMSFASGLMLRVPIVQFHVEDKLTVDVLPQIRQVSTASLPVFQSYTKNSIFQVAVNSFFDPPFKVNNLFIAIEWFVMNSSYAEVRLVNAMTVLENLISSNLNENDISIMPDKKEFEKSKKLLRKVIKQGFEKWSTEDRESQKNTLSDINENLANLNRRSLRQKLDLLADRWSVPLEEIGKTRINAVINARNLIVHQGHYNTEHNNNLWEHAMVARELVISFIFRAIGFQGNYISHLGRYHLACFPPKNDT